MPQQALPDNLTTPAMQPTTASSHHAILEKAFTTLSGKKRNPACLDNHSHETMSGDHLMRSTRNPPHVGEALLCEDILSAGPTAVLISCLRITDIRVSLDPGVWGLRSRILQLWELWDLDISTQQCTALGKNGSEIFKPDTSR